MKKFVYISLLFQFYSMSIVVGGFEKNSTTFYNISTQPAGLNDDFNSSASSQNLKADLAHQVNNNNNDLGLGLKNNFLTGEQLKENSLFDFGSEYAQADSFHQINNNNYHLPLDPNDKSLTDKSLTDKDLKEKGFYTDLSIQSPEWERCINVPRALWCMNEKNELCEQEKNVQENKFVPLEEAQAKELILLAKTISPGFNQKDYVKNRVLEMSPDRVLEMSPDRLSSSVLLGQSNQASGELSSSVALGKNKPEDEESPTPSCCSEVLEVSDYTKK